MARWIVLAMSRDRVDVQVFGSVRGESFSSEGQARAAMAVLRARNITLEFRVVGVDRSSTPANRRPNEQPVRKRGAGPWETGTPWHPGSA